MGNLSEKDARQLVWHICEALHRLGATVSEAGVHLEKEGMYFSAIVDGKQVWVQRGQGNFRYDDVAKELIARRWHPDPVTLTVVKEGNA
jgi:hypothetical protein